jgi:hypothetical protein
MLALVASRVLQVIIRRFLSLLDETVQQNHPAPFVDVEKHSCNSALSDRRSHLADAFS